jgi:hypothetical protein
MKTVIIVFYRGQKSKALKAFLSEVYDVDHIWMYPSYSTCPKSVVKFAISMSFKVVLVVHTNLLTPSAEFRLSSIFRDIPLLHYPKSNLE